MEDVCKGFKNAIKWFSQLANMMTNTNITIKSANDERIVIIELKKYAKRYEV